MESVPLNITDAWGMVDKVDWSDTPDASDWAWINGMGRSGTSMLSKLISSSPEAYIGNETQVVSSIMGMLLSGYHLDTKYVTTNYSYWNNEHWTGSQLRMFADAWRRAKCGDARIVGDKAGVYLWKRDLWRMLFPGSNFIYSFRHPLDNVTSLVSAPEGLPAVASKSDEI